MLNSYLRSFSLGIREPGAVDACRDAFTDHAGNPPSPRHALAEPNREVTLWKGRPKTVPVPA